MANKAQAMATQTIREVAPRVNQNARTMVSRLRDFTRIEPPILFWSKVN